MTTVETKVLKTDEELMLEMESQMSVNWEELDGFFKQMTSSSGIDTKAAFRESWLENKLPIFKMLGNKVKIERDAELGLTDSDVRASLEDFTSELLKSSEICDATAALIMILCRTIAVRDFLSNRLGESYDNYGMKFGKGMKVSRILGSITKDEREKYLIQTEFSKITQTFKVTGKIVISIDPVDIIMMSHNPDSQWRSCHAIDGGEFRAGAIAYTVDKSTFISYAYRRTGESYGLEVPNKLWRQIGYVNRDQEAVALSTHYPTTNQSNEHTVIEIFKEIFPDLVKENIDGDVIPFINRGRMHYNDITNGRSGGTVFIDLHGVTATLEESIERSITDDRFNTFNVGLQHVPSVYGGDIEDSEDI